MLTRNRTKSFIFILLLIPIGLFIRKRPAYFPDFIATYAPDALWALLVFFLFGFIFHKKSTSSVALMALAFSFLIEISQFYHAPWIDNLRATTLGALVLGHGFLWSDLVCYSVGIGLGYIGELFFLKKQ